MPYLIIALLALGIAVAQAGIGGMKPLYSLPAYGLIGLAAVCSLFEPARRISVGTRPLCLLAAIAMAACVVVRGHFSPVDYLARHDVFMTLAALAVYLLTAIFLSESRPRRVLVIILLVYAAAHFACGVVQFQSGQFMLFSPLIERVDYPWRASGFYLNPNHLAGLLECLGITAASLACWSNWRLVARMAAGYAALMCFIGVALTGSRGGYVSTLTGLLVLAGTSIYVVRRLRPAQFRPTLVVVLMLFSSAIAGGGTLMLKSQTLNDRLVQMEPAKNTRLTMWNAALKQFALSPLIGTGSGTYLFHGRQLRAGPIDRDPGHVENDYLELLCEYGILGALAMTFFLGVHLWNGIGGLRRIVGELGDVGGEMLNDELALLLGALSAVAALLVHSVLDCNLHVPGNTLVIACLFSILAAPTIETLLPGESAAPLPAVHWLRFLAPPIGLYLLVVGTPRVEAEFYAECSASAMRARDFDTAARCAESGLAVEKKNPNLFFLHGEARFGRASARGPEQSELFEQSGEFLDPLRAGLAIFPNDTRLLLASGRALDACGRFTEAAIFFENAIAADPNSHAVHANYGQHFELQNKPREAEEHYRRAVELGEPSNGSASTKLREIREQRKAARQPRATP